MDGPCNGPPPGTWDIYQAKPQSFVEATYYHVVPHTEEVRNRDLLVKSLTERSRDRLASRSLVRRCYDCRGKGRHRCHHCQGSGTVSERDAQGNHVSKDCYHCHGRGHRRCDVCDGTGKDFNNPSSIR